MASMSASKAKWAARDKAATSGKLKISGTSAMTIDKKKKKRGSIPK